MSRSKQILVVGSTFLILTVVAGLASGWFVPTETVITEVAPGVFVVHPPGEVHEYANGPQRTLLFRVRYGAGMHARFLEWRGHDGWAQSREDAAYFRDHPPSPGDFF